MLHRKQLYRNGLEVINKKSDRRKRYCQLQGAIAAAHYEIDEDHEVNEENTDHEIMITLNEWPLRQ